MSIIPKTIIKSVSLKKGEQFILPPGAVLIGATDDTRLTSTCDIGELEELKCYVFVIAVGGVEGNESQFYEGDSVKIRGIYDDGVLHSIKNTAGEPFFAAVGDDGNFTEFLLPAFQAIPNLPISFDCVGGYAGEDGSDDNPTDRGKITFVSFRTIPSFAEKIMLQMEAFAPLSESSDKTTVTYYIKPMLRTEALAQGYWPTAVCECSA